MSAPAGAGGPRGGDLSPNPAGYDAFKFFLRAYLNVLGLEFVNAHHIPASGAAIIASNHVTQMDPFAVGQPTPRRVHFMAKKELFRTPLGKWFYTSGNAFPVDRSKPDLGAIKTALRILQGGQLLVIFPQGTRGGQGAREGAGFLAIKGKAPVIPAGIRLLRNWWGGKRYRIVYGAPIPPEGTP